ncbi:hypothetical protein VTJ49DRAFT_3610 [Mycothermus thermophilus]|uniref:Uncharacterized protein n=1 Tax=Humicola insolens TaxID=85995 RepID=A0ABR3VM59_HUMIN
MATDFPGDESFWLESEDIEAEPLDSVDPPSCPDPTPQSPAYHLSPWLANVCEFLHAPPDQESTAAGAGR